MLPKHVSVVSESEFNSSMATVREVLQEFRSATVAGLTLGLVVECLTG